MDKLREEIENMALEFVINDIAKKRLFKIVDAMPSKYQIAREVWDEYTGYETLFGAWLEEKQ